MELSAEQKERYLAPRSSSFWCDMGQHEARAEHSGVTTGYGWGTCPGEEDTSLDNCLKACYECCAKIDRAYMTEHGQISLYLTRGTWTFPDGVKALDSWIVSNWPGSLKFRAFNVRESWHNFSGKRVDFQFHDEAGRAWWGFKVMTFGDICHCRRYQEKAGKTSQSLEQ